MSTSKINIRDINPLEHLTSDLAKARFNYASILNGLVEWNSSKLDDVTVRLMCDTDPGFVDYTFPTRRSAEGCGVNAACPDTADKAFSYDRGVQVAAMASGDAIYSDRLDIRSCVNNAAGSEWKICASAVIYDETCTEAVLAHGTGHVEHSSDTSTGDILVAGCTDATRDYIKGQFIRIYFPQTGHAALRWVKSPLSKGYTINGDNSESVVERWRLDHFQKYMRPDSYNYLFVVYDGKVYRETGTPTRKVPTAADSGWEYYCDVFRPADGETKALEHGKVYLYDPDVSDLEYSKAELFVYEGSDTMYGYPPYEIEENGDAVARVYNDGWVDRPLVIFPITGTYSRTVSVRWTVSTDIEAILLQRIGDGRPDQVPDVTLMPSIRISGGTTEDNGGFEVIPTSNYAEWPGTSPKWSTYQVYSTDTSKGASVLQSYTATMVFDHADPRCKQFNIVNYDGPDLDQGLAIYLPVESMLDGKVVYPCNGRTFEFLFRIWPNPAYNGHETADLIVNKAQIYVYSLPRRTSTECRGMPIAKFSMARLTNFYVFSENIAVPNRPVLVRARFVYSAEEKEWKTYDYYQLPDCVFLSPNGFVDPSRPSDDTSGVETAGFPLVQDPFSGYDLSPVLVDDSYRNRIG